MGPPKLKRVTIRSEQQLTTWLRKNTTPQSVMLVTKVAAAGGTDPDRAQVRDALTSQGWRDGRRYTLSAHQVGHVIYPPSTAPEQ